MAAEAMEDEGFDGQKHFGWKGIQRLNLEFRSKEGFESPIRKSSHHAAMLGLFPEAKTLLIKFGQENLETLNAVSVREHLLNEIVPVLLEEANKVLVQLNHQPINEDNFLKMCWLKLKNFKTTSSCITKPLFP